MRGHRFSRPARVRPLPGPRVWLATPDTTAESAPVDLPAVRDTWMRIWRPDASGRYCSGDGWHRLTWAELRSRFDLVEVLAAIDAA